ncbi:ATP-binding cassette domain-containing protein [bacterium]|nr:ATP-binding cassette domain-containing protein [bacterium]
MSTQQHPAIAIRGLMVQAGDTTILGPVDLDVQAGEHVLLVGPSGSGKSTLLRSIAGLETPAAGEIQLFGETVSAAQGPLTPPQDRGVGLLFQGGALWPHMTVLQTLLFVLKRRGLKGTAAKQRAEELLELVDLPGIPDQKAPTLSGGEAQRLSLARALAGEPRILLLDEPLGPLDAPRRAALLDRLAALEAQLGLTTLHVTHDPGEAERVATRTVSIDANGALFAPMG